MKYHFYSRPNNQIVMWGEKQIDAPKLIHLIIDITNEDLKKLTQNWRPSIKDGKLMLEISKESQETVKQINIQKLKNEIALAKDINDLKKLLTNFIDL